jgi:DNA-binding FrmR family transcriptional regulator
MTASSLNEEEQQMEIDVNKAIENAMRDAIQAGVKKHLVDDYNSPLKKLIEAAIVANQSTMRTLLEQGIASCMSDELFREEIKQGVRHHLAKILVQRFGGELEKQVNTLKSDPTTRARITLAIEQIVAGTG